METTVKYSFGFRAIVAAINLFHINFRTWVPNTEYARDSTP